MNVIVHVEEMLQILSWKGRSSPIKIDHPRMPPGQGSKKDHDEDFS